MTTAPRQRDVESHPRRMTPTPAWPDPESHSRPRGKAPLVRRTPQDWLPTATAKTSDVRSGHRARCGEARAPTEERRRHFYVNFYVTDSHYFVKARHGQLQHKTALPKSSRKICTPGPQHRADWAENR